MPDNHGMRRGVRRTRKEIIASRERMNARTRELLEQGMAPKEAGRIAQAEENARRDQEIMEAEVQKVIQEQLMGSNVADAPEVDDLRRREMDGEDVTDWGMPDTAVKMGDIMPQSQMAVTPKAAGLAIEVRETAQQLIERAGDGVTLDNRRLMPELKMHWDDSDASGEGSKAWDRMANEPVAWYQAFMVYLHAPPLERGVKGTYSAWTKMVGRPRKAGFTPPDWYKAAQKFCWEVRAEEYDKSRTDKFVQKMEMVTEQAEDELADALFIGLRKVVERVKTGDVNELGLGHAIALIPQLTAEIRKQLNMDQKDRVSLDMIMEALPLQLRQQVLLSINVGTVFVDGKGVERHFVSNAPGGGGIRPAPLADLTLTDRRLERELKELEEIEGELREVQASAGEP